MVIKETCTSLNQNKSNPKFGNDTRWASTFEMLKKYFKIIEPVKEMFANDMQVDRVAGDVPQDHYS